MALEVAIIARRIGLDMIEPVPGSKRGTKDGSLSADASHTVYCITYQCPWIGIYWQVHAEKQAEAGREAQLLAMIQNQEAGRAKQVAQIRDNRSPLCCQSAGRAQQEVQSARTNGKFQSNFAARSFRRRIGPAGKSDCGRL